MDSVVCRVCVILVWVRLSLVVCLWFIIIILCGVLVFMLVLMLIRLGWVWNICFRLWVIVCIVVLFGLYILVMMGVSMGGLGGIFIIFIEVL